MTVSCRLEMRSRNSLDGTPSPTVAMPCRRRVTCPATRSSRQLQTLCAGSGATTPAPAGVARNTRNAAFSDVLNRMGSGSHLVQEPIGESHKHLMGRHLLPLGAGAWPKFRPPVGVSRKWGVSRRLHQWRRGGRDRLKQVAEARAERAVVDRTPNLQQQVGASSRPSHLLRLVHPPVDQEVSSTFSHRRSDAQACTVSFGIIDEPSALATEIVIDLVQRVLQLAGWHTRSAMTALALEDMHDLADALECAPGIPALPFQIRQCNRSTSATIAVFAWIRPGSSVDNPLAACFACCSRKAMWNRSAIGGLVTPGAARIDRRPGQPSVNAVDVVAAVRPTVSN